MRLWFAVVMVLLAAAPAAAQGSAVRILTDDGKAVGASNPLPISGAGGGGVSATDKAGFTEGTSAYTPIGGVRNDTPVGDPAEDQGAAARITPKRALHVNIRDNSGNEVAIGGGTQYDQGTATTDTDKLTMAGCVRSDTPAVATGVVDGDRARCIVDSTGRLWVHVGVVDGTVTVTGSVTANAGTNLNTSALALDATLTNRLPAGATPADNESNAVTTSRLGTYTYVFDGTTWDRWQGGVSVTNTPTVTVGTFPDNEPFNLAQVAGTATATGNGTANAGTQRVTIASDNTAFTVNVGTFPDNEPFNVAQIAGTTTSVNAGNVDAGTIRVAPARNAAVCNPVDAQSVVISTAASGSTELVALTSGQTIYVCDFTVVANGTVEVKLVYGTGTNCATGATDMTGAMAFVANTGVTQTYDGRLKTAQANALCINLSAAVGARGVLTYRKAVTF